MAYHFSILLQIIHQYQKFPYNVHVFDHFTKSLHIQDLIRTLFLNHVFYHLTFIHNMFHLDNLIHNNFIMFSMLQFLLYNILIRIITNNLYDIYVYFIMVSLYLLDLMVYHLVYL